MEVKVHKLFPLAAMHTELERNITQEELNFILSFNNNLLENMGNTSSEDMDVLRHPELADLRKLIQKKLDLYFLYVYKPKSPKDIRLTLTQSWLNFTKPGEHHHPHAHPNSIISGCLYISAVKGEDRIVFQRRELPVFQIEAESFNDYNTFEYNIEVATNDIVLFPSNVLHRVPHTTSNSLRISLAFNSFFRGKLGNISTDYVNYLEIK